MGRLAATVATATLVAGALAAGTPTLAAPGAPVDCAIVDRNLVCGHEVVTPGSPGTEAPQPASAAPAGSDQPTAIWTREAFNRRPHGGDANIPSADVCTTPDGEPGTRYRDTLLSATGQVLDTRVQCVGDGEPAAPAPALPAAPPQPPTREEIVAAAPIPGPTIHRNPSGRGLTGLESWFWAEDPGTVEASVALRGWLVTGSLSAGDWIWDTGDGGRYVTDGPGSAGEPAVRHVYETKGTWPVSVQVSWSGSYTVAGYGTSYTVGGLTTAGSATVGYPVIEVRGVLDDSEVGADG